MSFAKSLLAASLLSLAAPLAAGCSGSPDAVVEANDEVSDEAELTASGDAKLIKDLTALLQGLETGGGEGDATPYTVMSYKPTRGESFNDQLLFKRFLPRMIPIEK